jgi:phthiocerol/phenolphthiocerol synthesis type-I polyketide synthase E
MSSADGFKTEIAVIGMAGRFPGAADADELWRNLREGKESIITFSDDDLAAAGIDSSVLEDAQYVKRRGFLKNIAEFAASFFGMTPREAEITDPQQRFFLECAWEALEHAGYDSEQFPGLIGVYGGTSANSYQHLLYAHAQTLKAVGHLQADIGNARDYLTTRVSYKLNLSGPSVVVQTACSTSLVAVHMACQSLLSGECDLALAGGVSISVPQQAGYFYQEGGVAAPDGHCRAFDASAQGAVPGSGVGIVVLKRLQDALDDGDTIHAVIKGSAINNDGANKAGFTAPSVEGQARVIVEALTLAGVEPDTISYVETHGTGTILGDPIEIKALTEAFRSGTDRTQFCAIGSLKTNLGHLDVAAGVAGLIKAVFALKHRQIPASLHFETPNPALDLDSSPFFVNTALSDWRATGPCRAGVSSFGIGGTNAHVILEEAPPLTPTTAARPWQLLMLSAKTETALEQATTNLVAQLEANPALDLADVAYTLLRGRRKFEQRRVLVCRDRDDALQTLRRRDPARIYTTWQNDSERPVAWMFPGQGAQYVGMGAELYRHEPTFRREVDRCCELLRPHLKLDLRGVLYPPPTQTETAAQQLQQTALAQPALFVIEYALAKLWQEWGIAPQAMIGHSIGEYVAATLADVMALEDALLLVATRGRLMQSLPGGAMLSVPLAEHMLTPLLVPGQEIAAVNSPIHCVVSGSHAAIDALQAQLTEQNVKSRLLHTSHAFHSAAMEPILDAFETVVRQVDLQPPTLPYISSLTGTWITAAEATNPRYWADQLRQPVRFAQGIATLAEEPALIFLELGPGTTLNSLVRKQVDPHSRQLVVSAMRHPEDRQADLAVLLSALGQLWLAGAAIDGAGVYAHQSRRRVPLPTYPFERQTYWIGGETQVQAAQQQAEIVGNRVAPAEAAEVAPALHPRPQRLRPYVEPGNPIEEHIATIWQDLIGIDQVGSNDHFFEIGGNSLVASLLIARLRETFPVEVPLRHIFDYATVAELATAIESLLIEKLTAIPDDQIPSLSPVA